MERDGRAHFVVGAVGSGTRTCESQTPTKLACSLILVRLVVKGVPGKGHTDTGERKAF